MIILTLLKRDFYEIRRNFIFYFTLFSLFPIISYLLLVIPFSHFILLEIRYLNWSAPGVWVITSAIVGFFSSAIRVHKLCYETNQIDAILSTPITNSNILFSLLLRSILIGIIQFIFSLIITFLLNNEYLSFLNIFVIFFHILIIIIFFSILGIFVGLIIKRIIFLVYFSIILFMILCFGMNLFIPMNVFPNSYYTIISKVPLVIIFTNMQNIITNDEISWLGYFFTFIISIILFVITMITSNKILRKI